MDIQPIDRQQQGSVIEKTHYYIEKASKIYQCRFELVIVDFDLKGRAAGMYQRKREKTVIRYNPYLFAKYFVDNFKTTIPHEVAHYIADMMFKNIRPHGKEWREIMLAFDADASRTCDYDLEGIPIRVHQRYIYRCPCMTHEITSRRHNKIQKNRARYHCKKCNQILTLKVVNG